MVIKDNEPYDPYVEALHEHIEYLENEVSTYHWTVVGMFLVNVVLAGVLIYVLSL